MSVQPSASASGKTGQVVRISLETWLTQTKLDEEEEASVLLLQQQGYGAASTQPATLLQNGQTPLSEAKLTNGHHSGASDAYKEGARSADDLFEAYQDWIRKTEQAMEDNEEVVCHDYLRDVTALSAACDEVSSRVRIANELFLNMTQDHDTVEQRASALHNACEELLDEQIRITEVATALSGRLEYFAELETATRILNLPAERIVLTDDFLSMLDRLDMCLEFFEANTTYKDSDLYIVRYEQCMTRSMTLIKLYFVSAIQTLASDSARKMASQQTGETARMALLYDKFRTVAEPLRNLLSELATRSQRNHGKFAAILSECHLAYCSARVQLLSPGILEEIAKINQGADSLLRVARLGYSYLLEVCHLEQTLWHDFFVGNEGPLYSYLETLSDNLSDLLRPRILRETDLNLLNQLCMAMQSLIVQELAEEEADDDEDARAHSSISMAYLFRNVLQDVQSRLIFRAQQIIESDIRFFSPRTSDLDYPGILSRAKGQNGDALISESGEMSSSQENVENTVKMPLQSEQETWYPTLKKVIWVLSKLYTYLNSAVFDDIAQDAIFACQQSLHDASRHFVSSGMALDSRLFVVRHLYLLRKNIARFDLERSKVTEGLDLTHLSTTLEDLRFATGYFNPFALMSAASKAGERVDHSLTDAKNSLNLDLESTRNGTRADVVDAVTQPLAEWLELYRSSKKNSNDGMTHAQEMDTLVKGLKQVIEAYRAKHSQYRAQIDKMKLYLDVELDTDSTVHAVELNVLAIEREFRKVVQSIGALSLDDDCFLYGDLKDSG